MVVLQYPLNVDSGRAKRVAFAVFRWRHWLGLDRPETGSARPKKLDRLVPRKPIGKAAIPDVRHHFEANDLRRALEAAV